MAKKKIEEVAEEAVETVETAENAETAEKAQQAAAENVPAAEEKPKRKRASKAAKESAGDAAPAPRKKNDIQELLEKGKAKGAQRYKDILEVTEGRTVPSWLEADHENLTGKVVEIPSRDVIDVPVNPTLSVELYSK